MLLGAGALPAVALAAASPFDVGDRSQLFLDKVLIAEEKGVWQTQHPARKPRQNPVLVADRPWEPWMVAPNTVIYDRSEKTLKMWYTSYVRSTGPRATDPNRNDYFDDSVICYATSSDGLRWEKPLVGTIAARNGKPHNAVAQMHPAGVIKDERDPDPARRYKMIGYGKGYHTLVSPDGLRWTRLSSEPIAPGGDVITGYFDDRSQRFVAFPKIPRNVLGHRRRSFSTMFSDDFFTWSAPVPSFTNDLRDDAVALAKIEKVRPLFDEPDDPAHIRAEFYGIGVYQAESCTVGFPWVLTTNAKAKYGNDQGLMEVQLAVSRDSIHWERPFRRPIIEFGAIDRWDSVNISSPSECLRMRDEIWLYYKGGNQTHGVGEAKRTGFVNLPGHPPMPLRSSVGLAVWTLDRFVSVDGPREGGTLLTVPLRFDGDRLEINGVSRNGGEITVEILDVGGRPLEGWEKSVPFAGDDVRHVVTFAGKQNLAKLAGKAISLRFNLRDAQLFGFAFRSGQKAPKA